MIPPAPLSVAHDFIPTDISKPGLLIIGFIACFLRSVVRLNPNILTTIPVLRARRGRENKYSSRPRRASNNSIVVMARKQLSRYRVRLDQFNALKNKGRFVYGSGEILAVVEC